MPKHNILFGETKHVPFPSDEYKVCLEGFVDDVPGKFGQDIFVLTFEIIEGEYKGCKCNCFVNQESGRYGTGNKMGKVVAALTGKEPEIDEYYKLDKLIGLKCRAFIELRRKGKQLVNRIYRLESLTGKKYEI